MKIEFVFAKNHHWWAILSDVICYLQGTKFSHSGIRVIDENMDVIYHSIMPKGKKQKIEDFYKDYSIIESYAFEIKDSGIFDEMILWLEANYSKKYSDKQLILLFSEYISGPLYTFLIGLKSFSNGKKRLICSEFVARFLENFFLVKWPENADTVDLVELNEMIKKLKG